MPDVEIDIDDLLDADSEEERALKLRVSSFQNVEPSGRRCLNPLRAPLSLQRGKRWDAKYSPS